MLGFSAVTASLTIALLSAAGPAGAATGRLEIREGTRLTVAVNPSGCLLLADTGTKTVTNHTDSTVQLFSSHGCGGVPASLAPGGSATGAYGGIYAP